MAASFSPQNQSNSEKISEKNAEANISKSAAVNFLNILFISFNKYTKNILHYYFFGVTRGNGPSTLHVISC